jgi:hypothetical protein
VWPVVKCERDSAYYLSRRDTSEHPSHDEKFPERMILAQMSDEEKDIADGFSAYKFNHKNHFSIARSNLILALKTFKEIDSTITDSVVLKIMCDTVDLRLGRAIAHYDSNAYFLGRQKSELGDNNVKKRNIVSMQNQRLISSTGRAIRNLKRGRVYSANAKAYIRSMVKKNYYNLRSLERSRRFDMAEFKGNCDSADTARSRARIVLLLDSLNTLDKAMPAKFTRLDSLFDQCAERMLQFSGRSLQNWNATKWIIFIRYQNIDDLDYTLRDLKDTLMKHKFSDDALLMGPDSICIVKYLVDEFNSLRYDFARFYQCRKGIANDYLLLKKCCLNIPDLGERYSDNLRDYRSEVKDNEKQLYKYIKRFLSVKIFCKAQIKPTFKEQKAYAREKSTEKKFFYWRGRDIRKHQASLLRLSMWQKAWCLRTKSKLQKKEKHLMRMIRESHK